MEHTYVIALMLLPLERAPPVGDRDSSLSMPVIMIIIDSWSDHHNKSTVLVEVAVNTLPKYWD